MEYLCYREQKNKHKHNDQNTCTGLQKSVKLSLKIMNLNNYLQYANKSTGDEFQYLKT